MYFLLGLWVLLRWNLPRHSLLRQRPAWIQSCAARAQHTTPRSCSQRCPNSDGEKMCVGSCKFCKAQRGEYESLGAGIFFRLPMWQTSSQETSWQLPCEFRSLIPNGANGCRLPGFCSPTAFTSPCPTVSPPIAWPTCSGQCLDENSLLDLKNRSPGTMPRVFPADFSTVARTVVWHHPSSSCFNLCSPIS